jgi:4'-phosphopantetheinyl transferase
LDVSAPAVEEAAGLLSGDEAERAARFVFALHRARWIAARAFLRRVLAARAGCGPRELRFVAGPGGKPALAHPAGEPRFSLSHAEGYAACAVTSGHEVGMDLEVVRPVQDFDAVAARFFSPRETDDLRALPKAERLRGFFECWTRKEAFLKATGDGLSRPLDSFSVTLGPGEPPRIRDTRPDAEESGRWSLVSLEPRPGLLAAVALPSGEWRVLCADASSLGRDAAAR